MAFILEEQRDTDCRLAFELYRRYLDDNEWKFPPMAFALAESDWWYDFNDPRCPHDSRMISVEFREVEVSGGKTEVNLSLQLAGTGKSGSHNITYSGITGYKLFGTETQLGKGHGDWRYDEFRVGEDRALIHEIEWSEGANWIIKCRDIEHCFTPNEL